MATDEVDRRRKAARKHIECKNWEAALRELEEAEKVIEKRLTELEQRRQTPK